METSNIKSIPNGTVTSAQGFRAGATYAGIKKKSENCLDLGILFSEVPCVAAGLFTTIKTKSAHVILCQQRLLNDRAMAVVANSGCANAFNGEQGMADATEITNITAEALGISPDDVLVASTGVTGQPLPVPLIKNGLGQIVLSADGGHDFARAIMTTDTVSKEVAVSARIGDTEIIIGGVAKGSGMIHPNMATMLCFLTTDAAVTPDFLKWALREAADVSLNMVSIDGDTSPSDTMIIMANGMAGNKPITANDPEADVFQQALNRVCIHLSRDIAGDGEGATKLIEVTVRGAKSLSEARAAARTVVSSPLVKAAIHGADPNWGRIITAVGRSGIEVEESRIDLYIGEEGVVSGGQPLSYNEKGIIKILQQPEIPITVQLNLGNSSATAWGCDLSEEYVTINSQYMT